MNRQARRRARPAALACLAGLLAVGSALAQVREAPAATRGCVACHGPQGLSVAPDAPNIAGQPEIYLQRQLKAYRSGTRQHEVMQVVARGLSDDDVDALAAWYSSLQVQLRTP